MERSTFFGIVAVFLAFQAHQCSQREKAHDAQRAAAKAKYEQAEANFDHICKDVAGYKIYKTVDNVDAIQLLKIRQEGNWGDLMEPGAAFAHEEPGDDYIKSFLFYEVPLLVLDTTKRSAGYYTIPLSPEHRGRFGLTPIDAEKTAKERGASPGYKYVDIFEGGVHYRVTSSNKVVGQQDVNAPSIKAALQRDPHHDLNIYRWTLDRTPTEEAPPRYAVTFEDYVIPEERAQGLASSRVKVIDTQTNEVLGEMLVYAWTTIKKPTPPDYESFWLSAPSCPVTDINDSAHQTRAFVDQVLRPTGSLYAKPAQ